MSTTISAFLAQMDGFSSENEEVLIIGATNAPWDVDSAFKRPGRFDTMFFVPPPDLSARVEIFKILLKDMPISNIDYDKIAIATNNFSGADIKGVIEDTTELIIEKILENGGKEIPINTGDILKMVKNKKPTTLEWFEMAKNVVEFANEAGLYDDVKLYINKLKPQRKKRLGFF